MKGKPDSRENSGTQHCKVVLADKVEGGQPLDLQLMDDGYFYKNRKLYVPTSLQEEVLKQCHDNKPAGPFGFVKTWHLLQKRFSCLE